MGIGIVDYIVLALYFIFLVIIGVLEAKKIKLSKDFFMPQKFGKLFMMMFSFGAGTHADQAVGVSSKSYTNGLSGIWYQWLYLFATPFYWLIAPVMKRFRAITMSDVFEFRFNRSVGILFAAIGVWNLVVIMGLMLIGSSEVLSSSMGGFVSIQWNSDIMSSFSSFFTFLGQWTMTVEGSIAIMTLMFVIYGVAGGLSAAIIIGFVQGVLIIIFSFILLPLVLNKIGGFAGLHQKIGNPEMLSLVAPGDINVFYVVVLALNALIGIVTQPHVLAGCSSGRTELDGQIGFMGGNFLKRLVTIPWCFTGVAAAVYFAGRTVQVHPDRVYGTLANEFLPLVFPGALGIFIAGIISAVMNGCSTFMLSAAALFTENVYKPIFHNKTQKHYIFVGRIASVIVVIVSVWFAYWLAWTSTEHRSGVIKGLEIFWIVSAMMAIAFWLGLFWRRTTSAGAWASVIVSVGAWWLTTHAYFVSWLQTLPACDAMKFVVTKGGESIMYLPWQMLFYLIAGTVAGVAVSLVTKPVQQDRLDKFYALVRTPVRPGDKITTPCTLPADLPPAPRRNLIPSKNWEIPVPSKGAITGFVAAWGFVAVLIYTIYFLAGLGKN